MTWKLLGQGHGHGYVEYWDFSATYPHPEHPTEIPDDVIEDTYVVDYYNDDKYTYIIHHMHDTTFNYFRYAKE